MIERKRLARDGLLPRVEVPQQRDDQPRLVQWAIGREMLRLRKAQGLLPWTTDPILRQYRFCNVRRSDDRVSQWLIKHVLTDDRVATFGQSFMLFSALCRWINWPPTIQAIIDAKLWPRVKLRLDAIAEVINQRAAAGDKVWTGAYTISAPKGADRNKARFVTTEVVAGLAPHWKTIRRATMVGREATWNLLIERPYIGRFMAGQIVADWGYTYLLRTAPDTNTWAPQGPGSVRGFNRMVGRPIETTVSVEEWGPQLQVWRTQIVTAFAGAFDDWAEAYDDLTLHDVQNCLCEFDKYERVRLGEGRPRSRYTPETAF